MFTMFTKVMENPILYTYTQTQFQKSWDTVQIVSKKSMKYKSHKLIFYSQ